jgi:predicted  nucleic acid-binding Zn-ribbon protein
MTQKIEIQNLKQTLETLAEEKFHLQEMVQTFKQRALNAEKKIGYLLDEIDRLKSGSTDVRSYKRRDDGNFSDH